MTSSFNSYPPGWEILFTPAGRDFLSQIRTKRDSGASFLDINGWLRKNGVEPEHAAALTAQAELREKAEPKFGEESFSMLFTQAGLEQASRRILTKLHATRIKGAGVEKIVDLGCGVGSQSLSFLRAGIVTRAVEIDALTSRIAAHNLETLFGAGKSVINEDATSFSFDDAREAAFFDPARRTAGVSNTRRLTSPLDYSPNLNFIFETAAKRPTGIKLGPAFPHEVIPEGLEAQWISVNGDLLECVLWSKELRDEGASRAATVISQSKDNHQIHTLKSFGDVRDAPVQKLGRYIYEPDGAVIRARQIGTVARALNGGMLDDKIAYITSSERHETPFARGFEVIKEVSPKLKNMKKELAELDIGSLEIKKRGVDIDPAILRKQLKLSGSQSAVLFLTRTGDKHLAFIAQRI